MATVKDIARLAGVSPTTVSWALNGKRVSEESLRRVLEAARELNYHPKMSARSLRAGKVFSIGFYIVNPSLDPRLNGYLFPMLAGISKVLADDNYAMQFDIITPDKLDILAKKALEHSVDGMLILPQFSGVTERLLEELPDKFPVVYMQQDPAASPEHCVVIDQAKGVELAIRHLYDLGHRQIGVIAGPKEHVDNVLRLRAARGCSRRWGWRGGMNGCIRASSIWRAVRRACAGFWTAGAADGLFCFNDYMAIGALRAAAEAGLKVPDEMSILGFDDTDVAEATRRR